MANYSTAADIDTYAISVGDVDWLDCDSREMTALINLLAGYSAAATSLAFDALDVASGIEAYNVLKIGSEYLLVTAVTYATTTTGTLTVTRGYYGSTAAAISDNAVIYVKDQRKNQCINYATDDIVGLHGQVLYPDELWLSGQDQLIEAEKRQTLWVNKYLEERESSERIKQLTQGEYTDGAISLNPVTKPMVDPRAALIVRQVMRDNEVQANAFKRG